MDTETLDKLFDAGEDITPYLDLSTARRPNLEARKLQVDLPAWILESLNIEARKTGVTTSSLVKMWLAERISHGEVSAAH